MTYFVVMKVKEIQDILEKMAPPALQESYDNCGLIIGNPDEECTGIIVCLDVTEAVINEATEKNCNLVVAHHPIIFKGLKKINGKNYVERTVLAAIRSQVNIYAIHTNLDNIIEGVSGEFARRLGLVNCRVLEPKAGNLVKLCTYVPTTHSQKLKDALFAAGAGNIGSYSECSFTVTGTGTYKPGEGTDPFLGKIGERHSETEDRVEVIFPEWKERGILKALKENHPYEEVAYELLALKNTFPETGLGIVGDLENPMEPNDFLRMVSDRFGLKVIRHSPICVEKIKEVALCGGSGSSFIGAAIASGAEIYLTGDIKYHEFFDAEDKLILADIGHYESEQFTIELLTRFLQEKLPTFAVLKTGIMTNPVHYFQ